jgi:peptide/nickel transport system substrate-binding protein
MLIENWGPDYMDPHTNADTFARNTDNSDATKIEATGLAKFLGYS